MGRCKFIRPETTILTLPDGDTLTVRKRLTHGERHASYARVLTGKDGGVNPLQVSLSLVTSYLLDWSLTGFDGEQVLIRDQPLDVVESALNALDEESFDDIKNAIDAHDKAMAKERKAEQKKRAGATTSLAPTGSPVALAGGTSGSPN